MLSPLESPENIIATHTARSLEISLPRLHLLFFVNSDGELESRSMPNYVVDKTQSFGTLFGLKNKLILCPRPNRLSSEESLLPRRVIIPQGKISYCTIGDFASVSINTDAEEQVRWYEYTIDADLGCLTSNTSLRSKLYQCYLHALTSHCLPDPLLGHTGTEEALYILRSAACRSFQRLDSQDAELLQLISNLTPKRGYYPPYLQSMATVKWNDLPILSQHHGFWETASTILDQARVLEALYDQPTTFDSQYRDLLLLNRAASRNKLYYPSDLQISELPSSLDDVEYISRDVLNCETDEDVACRTSWSIWNFQPSLKRRSREIWNVMKSWDSVGSASSSHQAGKVSLRYSRYWLECDVAQDWFVIYDLCRHVVNEEGPRSVKIKLSFCLSAAALAYSKSESKYLDIIPFFIAVSLDERFHFLSPPPLADTFYTLSDGVSPGHTNLQNLISQSALPINSIPGDLLNAEKEILKNARKKRRTLRKTEKYESIIEEKSSCVARSVLHHWNRNDNSLDYGSVDFHEFTLWFNKSECLRLIEKHIQSILKNIEFKSYVRQLERILGHYADVSELIPPPPYKFSPQFIPTCTKAPSYSIQDALLSRHNVPTPSAEVPFLDDGIPLTSATATASGTTATTGTLAPVGPDSLKVLVEEFLHSRQPLLVLYGDELNKSHRELMGNGACQSPRGALPSQELLRFYHNKCSQLKDKVFSEISETLAPSQNVEKANAIAGLWPRITNRSLLRQLAQDRIGTLPDEWKALIIRYAVCFLKYQQSQRLLDLASIQKSEEFLREIESMRSGVLAESTPDWLLVQVRPLCFMRSH